MYLGKIGGMIKKKVSGIQRKCKKERGEGDVL